MFPEPRGNKKKKKKWKRVTLFLKDNFLAWRVWEARRVISPDPTWSVPLSSPLPVATLPVTFVRRRSSPPKLGSEWERGWFPQLSSTLMAQDPFVSVAIGYCPLVSRYQLGIVSACHWFPQPTRPDLEVSGEGTQMVPHQPAISLANSHHPIYSLAAAFADWSIKCLLFVFKLLPFGVLRVAVSQSQCRKSYQIPTPSLASPVLGLHLNWWPTAKVINSAPHFVTGKINTISCTSRSL